MYSKYHARKVTIDGIVFDSAKEARRYRELRLMERAGLITDLERQKRYRLIPSQKLSSGKRERPVDYVADFEYRNTEGRLIVEDTKGVKTKDYIIKRKLMKYVHNIEIREV